LIEHITYNAIGTLRPYLPPDMVRLIDAMLRMTEREEVLRANDGIYDRTVLWFIT